MRILIIDDNRFVVRLIEESLKKFEVEVTSFTSSPNALNYFKNHHQEIDLIITDIMMPEVNGIDLCERALKIKPNIAILAITAGGNGEGDFVKGFIHREVSASGADEVLQKPFSPSDLEEAINRVVRAA